MNRGVTKLLQSRATGLYAGYLALIFSSTKRDSLTSSSRNHENQVRSHARGLKILSSVPSLSSAIKLGENISGIWDELREGARVIQVSVSLCGAHVTQGMGSPQGARRTRVHLQTTSVPAPHSASPALGASFPPVNTASSALPCSTSTICSFRLG